MTQQKHKIKPFTDECVIYFYQPDKCWVAHSLKTDQIGTGECVVDSLADLILAVNQCVEAANEDPTIGLFRDAPDSIKKKVANAEMLPLEIYEIAYKKVHGTWPAYIKAHFESKKSQPLITSMPELMTA